MHNVDSDIIRNVRIGTITVDFIFFARFRPYENYVIRSGDIPSGYSTFYR